MQNLTVRLEMVFGQVKAAASGSSEVRVIDVGSDHGYLALRCLEDGIAKNAVCTEIHEGPARKSQAALKGAGYSEVSEVHVTDGLIGVPLKDNDIVVIAGMGGLNIIDIISQAMKDNGTDVLKNVTFVLQPQKSNEIVRKYVDPNMMIVGSEEYIRINRCGNVYTRPENIKENIATILIE